MMLFASFLILLILLRPLFGENYNVEANIIPQQMDEDPLHPRATMNLGRPKYLVLTTWLFGNATQAAYDYLSKENSSALDAAVVGCSYCETNQCDYTVGFGGSPDENGETTLDAMIFDGDSMDVGAVAGLRRIKNAIGVAKAVLKYTEHTILVGDAATKFAIEMGFKEETLNTNRSVVQWNQWRQENCQPNFWKGVAPDPKSSCGPYIPTSSYYSETDNIINLSHKENVKLNAEDVTFHHDTIGQIVLDSAGHIVTGSSSNGAIHKIPGRMGDAAVPGAGGYADASIGACVATGDGDVMMRFSPAAQVVDRLKAKMSVGKATRQVINIIRNKYPQFKGAVLAMNKNGDFGAACNGIKRFPFTVANSEWNDGIVRTYYVHCVDFLSKYKT